MIKLKMMPRSSWEGTRTQEARHPEPGRHPHVLQAKGRSRAETQLGSAEVNPASRVAWHGMQWVKMEMKLTVRIHSIDECMHVEDENGANVRARAGGLGQIGFDWTRWDRPLPR